MSGPQDGLSNLSDGPRRTGWETRPTRPRGDFYRAPPTPLLVRPFQSNVRHPAAAATSLMRRRSS